MASLIALPYFTLPACLIFTFFLRTVLEELVRVLLATSQGLEQLRYGTVTARVGGSHHRATAGTTTAATPVTPTSGARRKAAERDAERQAIGMKPRFLPKLSYVFLNWEHWNRKLRADKDFSFLPHRCTLLMP